MGTTPSDFAIVRCLRDGPPPSTSRASKLRWHVPCNVCCIVNARQHRDTQQGAIRASAGSVMARVQLPQSFRAAARLRTSRHKVAVPQTDAGLRCCCRA